MSQANLSISTKPTRQDEAALKFGRAYQEYAEALAAVAKFDADPLKNDDGYDDVSSIERLRRAEHTLILTPAQIGSQLVQKFEVLEAIICAGDRDGWPTDKRHLIMAAAVKAELYDFKMDRKRCC
jgi:hypothetical protein